MEDFNVNEEKYAMDMVLEDNEECDSNKSGYDLDEIEYYSGKIALEEEAERCIRFKEDYEVSDETKNSGLYKEAMIEAETFIAMAKKLINDGAIDYNNALAFCSNHFTNKHNLEIQKLQSVQMQQNQI